ncbi:MAG: FtsW/RodA/SpoVE family cell cycle protein, partial [Dehalococcoidia bacterium]|nr:FtsW/RodA/SpoVE family cell cycle protein [Dehalococcoidia bacterium]
INIGGITLTIPFTGLPLPFISSGGSALLVVMAAIGILLNVSQHSALPDPHDDDDDEPVDVGRSSGAPIGVGR